MIQAELEAFVGDEAQARRREVGGRFFGPVSVVRLDIHSVQQAQPPQRVNDAIDQRRWDRDDHTAAGTQQVAARGNEGRALAVRDMLEDGEEREDVIRPAVTQVSREAAADQTRALWRVRVDADGVVHPAARRADKCAVRATDVEEPPAGGDVRQRFSDPEPLDEPVERCHAAAGSTRATAALSPAGSRHSSSTIATKNPSDTSTLKVSSCRSTAMP